MGLLKCGVRSGDWGMYSAECQVCVECEVKCAFGSARVCVCVCNIIAFQVGNW